MRSYAVRFGVYRTFRGHSCGRLLLYMYIKPIASSCLSVCVTSALELPSCLSPVARVALQGRGPAGSHDFLSRRSQGRMAHHHGLSCVHSLKPQHTCCPPDPLLVSTTIGALWSPLLSARAFCSETAAIFPTTVRSLRPVDLLIIMCPLAVFFCALKCLGTIGKSQRPRTRKIKSPSTDAGSGAGCFVVGLGCACEKS